MLFWPCVWYLTLFRQFLNLWKWFSKFWTRGPASSLSFHAPTHSGLSNALKHIYIRSRSGIIKQNFEILIMFSSSFSGVLILEPSRLMSLHKRSSVYEDWTNFSKTLKCSADIDEGLCYYICWCCDLLENIKVFEKLRVIFQSWSDLALRELKNTLKNKALCDIFGWWTIYWNTL